MSPLTVRRYRAERLLRQHFDALRSRVTASVRTRLRASGVRLDEGDLEACYALAWQGLYAAVLEGQEIANPTAWLTLVTFRRAIDEHRARSSLLRAASEIAHDQAAANPPAATAPAGAYERDFAAELDDRMRLRQLFEGLRGRLSAREREAAALCYLQGLTRAEAAARMGVSESRMRKLMEGHGGSAPGVAGKVGALVASIADGRWCEEQGSLMRAFAYGILDPGGERQQLALAHHDDCPACRAYVRELRGLAVVLPPVLTPWGLGVGALVRGGALGRLARAGAGHGGVGPRAGARGASGGGAGATHGTAAGAPLGSAAASLSGAASAGGAVGGSSLLAGSAIVGKFAAGCLLALGVGAGCIALSVAHHASAPAHRRRAPGVARVSRAAAAPVSSAGYQLSAAPSVQSHGAEAPQAIARAASTRTLTPASRASREFGPEQAPGGGETANAAEASAVAVAASTRAQPAAPHAESSAVSVAGSAATAVEPQGDDQAQRQPGGGAGEPSKAEREFSPG
jgi:RNA polymerase sigma factor (sigma-70 family)